MSEVTPIPHAPVVKPPTPSPAVLTPAKTGGTDRTIANLRKEYERLAQQTTVEVNSAGDKTKIAELMEAKKKAHAAWHDAVVADRHAKRDAAKELTRSPAAGR